MKMRVFSIVSFALLLSSLVAGHWFGLVELYRLSIWCTWAFSIFGFITLCIPSDDFFRKTAPRSAVIKVLVLSHLFLLVAAGCYFTATIFTASLVAFRMKWVLWKAGKKKQAHETTPHHPS